MNTIVIRQPPDTPPPEVTAYINMVHEKGRLLKQFSPFPDDGRTYHPYLDNEDWPALRALSNKGPLVEIWSLEE